MQRLSAYPTTPQLGVMPERLKEMEPKAYLGELHDRCSELLSEIKFDKHHILHFCLVSLYSSLIELVGCILILMKNNAKLGIRPLFRTFLETYVEFQNLSQDPKYGYHIDANDLKEWLKVLRAARDTNNPYLVDIGALPNLDSIIKESEQQLQEPKDKGYEPLNIYYKFKRADMEEEFRSLYNFLCTESHSNKRALINRHAEINDSDYDIVLYKNPPDESFLPVLDSAAGLLVSATIRLHEVLDSCEVSKAKLLEEGLKEARSKGSLKNNFTFLFSDLGCNSTSETSYDA